MTSSDVKKLVERLEKLHGIADARHVALAAISALTLLSEERDGYRLALRRIADHNNAFLTDGSEATRKCIDHLVEGARAALKEGS